MQNNLWHILLFSTLLALSSACRQDFNLTTDYKETTIAYGLLSTQDSVHYIRVQRGFIDSDENALQIAKDPDSIYYDDLLEIKLIDLTGKMTYRLYRLDGNEFNLAKDSGLFANEPNVLYWLRHQLNDTSHYRLQVFHPNMPDTVYAETRMVGRVNLNLPTDQYVINWTGGLRDNVGFSWRHEEGVGIYDMKATFWYTERTASGKKTVKNVSWKIFTNKLVFNNQPGSLVSHNYRTAAFFQNVGGRIPVDTTVSRQADSVTFVMAAGGLELAKLISNQQVRNGLLTGMALPFYTNIENGYGIFSSIYRDTISNDIGEITKDSLRWGQYTSDLRFQ